MKKSSLLFIGSILAIILILGSSFFLYSTSIEEITGTVTISTLSPNAENSYLVHEAKPGDVIEDSIQIVNYFDYPIEIDAKSFSVENPDTSFTIIKNNPPLHSFANWIEFLETTDDLHFDARSSLDIPIRITIPEDTPEGDYWGALFASYKGAGINEAAIKQVFEIGLRANVKVSDNPQEIERILPASDVFQKTNHNQRYLSYSLFITSIALFLLLLVNHASLKRKFD